MIRIFASLAVLVTLQGFLLAGSGVAYGGQDEIIILADNDGKGIMGFFNRSKNSSPDAGAPVYLDPGIQGHEQRGSSALSQPFDLGKGKRKQNMSTYENSPVDEEMRQAQLVMAAWSQETAARADAYSGKIAAQHGQTMAYMQQQNAAAEAAALNQSYQSGLEMNQRMEGAAGKYQDVMKAALGMIRSDVAEQNKKMSLDNANAALDSLKTEGVYPVTPVPEAEPADETPAAGEAPKRERRNTKYFNRQP